MKLQLNDSEKTIITSFVTKISRYGSWDEINGYHYIIEVNGLTLKYLGNTSGSKSEKDFDKMFKKGAVKIYKTLPLTEEEEGLRDGTHADLNDPTKHGKIMYSVLDNSGSSGVFVWDYYNKKIVKRSQLTNI